MLRSGAIFGLLAALIGCATAPQNQPEDPEAAWTRRQTILSERDTWALSGKLAINTGQEGWFADLDWSQDGEDFRIDLKDSFGRIVARIEGDETGVTLTQSNGATSTAADAESLLRDLYGWALPLSGLRYWVLGVPRPDGHAKGRAERRQLDAYGRLTGLRQAGWAVDYQHYQELEPVALPDKIAITGHDLRVKLIVEEWELAGT